VKGRGEGKMGQCKKKGKMGRKKRVKKKIGKDRFRTSEDRSKTYWGSRRASAV
jgi:hypothetical protein